MFRKVVLSVLLFIIHQTLLGQNLTDSIQNLNEVVVKAYFTPQPLLRSPSSAIVIDSKQINLQPGNSMVSTMNIIPGVRMEERSPGSYRLSIRGSLLRSPFGVRNVKIYMDEFPLTDASGNTYLNFLDIKSISGIEVLKGPDGSLFGANSGGVVLIDLFEKRSDSTSNSVDFSAGSYGLIHDYFTVKKYEKNYQLKISQGYQRYEGYRTNSSMRRNFLQAEQCWNYSPKNEVRALLLYSDYGYLTPGGLTLAQMESNPTSARPSTPTISGAVVQHASVRNQILSGGVLHEAKFSDQLRHVISVFGSHVNFGNTSIANIESTTNDNLGVRTYFELSGKKKTLFNWQWDAGLEAQETLAKISNFGNVNGLNDTLQAANRINVQQYFLFSRFHTTIYDRLTLEAAVSVNNFQYKFGPLQSTSALTTRKFKPQLMPKLALSYTITENIIVRALVSRGFSPPTIDEIRSSNNVVNTELQPENGLNYETGIRLRSRNNRFWLDALVFNYKLQDAIVRRQNPNGAEYFVNVGGTKQLGFESTLSAWIIEPHNCGLIHGLQLNNSLTLSKFTFSNYQKSAINYSGNKLTGVPEQVVITSLSMTFPAGFYLFAQHNYTARIPLNDANSVFSNDYNLIQVKAGWRIKATTKYNLEFYFGVDNLLNEKYSLGNDLNAAGGRYYNPSPPRNYFCGMKIAF
jgi:iron complex outermembrane receptor protein